MGSVVAFGARSLRRARPPLTQPCEITIFPGVRYERHDAALAVAAKAKRLPKGERRPRDETRG